MYKFFLCLFAVSTHFLCLGSHAIQASSLTDLASNAHVLAFGALFFALLYSGSVCISFIIEKYLSIPRTAGLLLSGIILGKSGLDIARFFTGSYQISHFASHVGQYDFLFQFFTGLTSLFAISWLMWLAGHETDLKKVKSVGFVAIAAGTLGALVPFLLCALTLPFLGVSLVTARAIGLMFAATSISIPVALFVSLGKMESRPARATLAAAVVDDIVAVIMVSVFFSFAGGATLGASSGVFSTIATMILGLGSLLAFGFYIFPFIYSYARSFHAEAPFYIGVIALFLFYAGAELTIGLAGITGAYFAGFFHARNADASLEHTVEPFITRLLLPLFLVGVALQLDVTQLSLQQWAVVALLTLLAIASKLLACSGVIAIENYRNEPQMRWTWSENLVFGFSMVARGEVGLVVASLVKSAGFIDESWYAAAVVALILTTIITPLLVAAVFAYDVQGQDQHVPISCSLESVEQGLLGLGIKWQKSEKESLVVEFEGSRLFLKKQAGFYTIAGQPRAAARCAQVIEKIALEQGLLDR